MLVVGSYLGMAWDTYQLVETARRNRATTRMAPMAYPLFSGWASERCEKPARRPRRKMVAVVPTTAEECC